MTIPPKLVVFSDLDGTLLDHDTYHWDAATPALTRLAAAGCPVVLTSSKTAAEIAVLQAEMGLEGLPVIAENGAGVVGLSDAQLAEAVYQDIRSRLDHLPKTLRALFRGFGDMTADEVSDITGLPRDAAHLAQHRDFSEPGVWSGTAVQCDAFLKAMAEQGLHATQGGRFLTLSFGATKAGGMAQVLAHYRPDYSVALGDAPNDITMLEAADFGIIVANPHHDPLPTLKGEAEGRISRTVDAGTLGWNTAICALLDTLGIN